MPGQFRKYEIGERIGIGGMAEVFRASAIAPDGSSTVVVVKKILPHLSEDAGYRQMFMDEAKIASTLDHPGIVKLLDLGRMDDQLFLALELVDGADLNKILRQTRDLGERLPVAVTIAIMIAVMRALHYAHTRRDPGGKPLGIVHRDISPSNILLSRAGHVKIADFGVAKATVRDDRTSSGVVKGNMRFMAPEQVKGLAIDARTDVFAGGILLLTLLCGKHPFDDQPIPLVLDRIIAADVPMPSVVVPGLPKALDAIVARATRADPRERYQSAQELAKALETFAEQFSMPVDPTVGLRPLMSSLLGAPEPPPDVSTSKVMRVEVTNPEAEELPVYGTEPAEPQKSPFAADAPEEDVSRTVQSHPQAKEERTLTHPQSTPRPKQQVPAVSLVGHRRPVSSVTITPDGRRVISGGHDQKIRVWDLVGKVQAKEILAHPAAVTCLALSADGTQVLSGSRDRTAKLWRVDGAGEPVRTLEGHDGWIFGAALSADMQFGLTGAVDRSIRLWHLGKGRPIATLEGHTDTVSCVAFLPDGLRAISGSYDRTVRIWSLETGLPVAVWQTDDAVRSLAIAPDGRRAISAGADCLVTVWDFQKGKSVDRLAGHREAVVTVAWSPDGKRALSGSFDTTVKLWDMERGVILRTFVGHTDPVLSVCFTPDGLSGVSGSADGTIRIFAL